MEQIFLAAASPAGVIGLVVGLFWMLSTGRLVTRRESDNIALALNAQIAGVTADRDMWRETTQTLTPIVTRVLNESETTNKLLRALPSIPEVDGS